MKEIMSKKKLLLTSLYIITVLGVALSIYAFYKDKAQIGSLVGALTLITTVIAAKLAFLKPDLSSEEKEEKAKQFTRFFLDSDSINLLRMEVIKRVSENHYLLYKIDFDKYIKIDFGNKSCFEGATTACICFFEIYDKMRVGGKIDYKMIEMIISFMGLHYLTTQKEEIIEKKFESCKIILELWNRYRYDEIPKEIIGILNNYCSHSDNDFFYDGWLSFSVLSFMESFRVVEDIYADNVQNKEVYLLSFIISTLNGYLNFYVKQTDSEGYLFWFMVEYYIRYKLNFIDEEAKFVINNFVEMDKVRNTELNKHENWKEHIWKELDLNKNIIRKWEKRFSDFQYDKVTGVLIILNEQKLNLYR
jgi:hypothetical protein